MMRSRPRGPGVSDFGGVQRTYPRRISGTPKAKSALQYATSVMVCPWIAPIEWR